MPSSGRAPLPAAILGVALVAGLVIFLSFFQTPRPQQEKEPLPKPAPPSVTPASFTPPPPVRSVPLASPLPTPSPAEVREGPQGSHIEVFKRADGSLELSRQIDRDGHEILVTRETEGGQERTEFTYDQDGRKVLMRVYLNNVLKQEVPNP